MSNDNKQQKSHALYEQAEKLGGIGHFEWDEESRRMINCSQQYARIFELSMDETLSSSSGINHDLQGTHPDDLEQRSEAESRAVKNAQPLEIEYRYICTSGQLKYIHQLSDVIKNPQGKVIRTYGTVQDISARKLAEQESHKRQQMFERAEELGQLGHWEWDQVEGRLIFCSQQYANIFGLSVTEIMARSSHFKFNLQNIYPGDKERVYQDARSNYNTVKPTDIEYRIIDSHNSLRHVHHRCEVEVDDKGKVVRSFGTLQDITESKTVMFKLRRSNMLYQQAEKMGHIGHWEWDENEDRMINCSEEFARIYGLSIDEALETGQSHESDLQLVHKDDRQRVRNAEISAFYNKSQLDIEYRIITKSGDVRLVKEISDVQLNENGHAVRTIGTVQDITESKHAELELQYRQQLFEDAERLGKLGHWEWDIIKAHLISCSQQYAAIFGFSHDEMIKTCVKSKNFLNLTHPDDRDFVLKAYHESLEDIQEFNIEYRIVTQSGSVRYVRELGNYKTNARGTVVSSFGTIQDITEQKHIEIQLKEQQVQFEEAEKLGRLGHWTWNIELDCLASCSEEYARIHEMSIEECLTFSSSSDNDLQSIHPEDRAAYRGYLDAIKQKDNSVEIQCRLLTGQGNTHFVHEIARSVFNASGKLVSYIGTLQDITERIEIEQKLRNTEIQFELTFQNAPIGMALVNRNGNVREINNAATQMLGYAQHQVINSRFIDMIHPDERTECGLCLQALSNGEQDNYHTINQFQHRDGHYIWVDLHCSLLRDTQGVPSHVIAQGIDITEQRNLSEKLSYQASHDSLTSLINRQEFEVRLDRLIDSAHSSGTVHTLCYMDLDQFKIINDTFGHAAGDELLRQLCHLIQKEVRTRDTLARLGGDEFGLLMEHCPLDVALKTIESLRKRIDAFRFIWDERVLSIGVSIGIVAVNRDSLGSGDVMKAADRACYMAKDAGRHRVVIYSETDKDTEIHRSQMQWATRIQEALSTDQLYLVGQSIEDLNSKKSGSAFFELLLRRKDDNGNLVSAVAMLTAAERYGLVTKIDEWVIEKACSSILSNSVFLESVSLCSINISGQSLSDLEFLNFIENTVERYGIPPGKICFEITETAAISNFTKAIRFMERLRSRGFYFALDDFGTGLSSFAYLKQLPVDFVKIDGAFIKDMVTSPTSMAVVKSINELVHIFGKRSIAEYVESPEILEMVKSLGVDFAQGYCVGMPKTLTVKPKLKAVK